MTTNSNQPADSAKLSEIERLIDAIVDVSQDDFDPKPLREARTALRAAIKRYGDEQYEAGKKSVVRPIRKPVGDEFWEDHLD